MTLRQYLGRRSERIPAWLKHYQDGDRFGREQFFASRIVYYPGSGTDGHPVELFGSTHSAHCFVYVDYGVTQSDIERELSDPGLSFRGYRTISRYQLAEHDLIPRDWVRHTNPDEVSDQSHVANVSPFGFLEVLERERELDDKHGAHRLAILFLGADGIAAYDALFCQDFSDAPPFVVVIEDHGFGGNYDRFGAGGLLERIAYRCDTLPQWLLVADDTAPWCGFERVANIGGDCGGAHNRERFLYESSERQSPWYPK